MQSLALVLGAFSFARSCVAISFKAQGDDNSAVQIFVQRGRFWLDTDRVNKALDRMPKSMRGAAVEAAQQIGHGRQFNEEAATEVFEDMIDEWLTRTDDLKSFNLTDIPFHPIRLSHQHPDCSCKQWSDVFKPVPTSVRPKGFDCELFAKVTDMDDHKGHLISVPEGRTAQDFCTFVKALESNVCLELDSKEEFAGSLPKSGPASPVCFVDKHCLPEEDRQNCLLEFGADNCHIIQRPCKAGFFGDTMLNDMSEKQLYDMSHQYNLDMDMLLDYATVKVHHNLDTLKEEDMELLKSTGKLTVVNHFDPYVEKGWEKRSFEIKGQQVFEHHVTKDGKDTTCLQGCDEDQTGVLDDKRSDLEKTADSLGLTMNQVGKLVMAR